ncbi:MAG: hypothetical protein GY798_05560 [Hyphomicrobiales bacterium]|nr:hypothetical protein [Hyphomicrobiales bacterium]
MSREVPREQIDLQPNPEVLSPPYLENLYRCAVNVVVHGFVPHAELDVDVDGTVTTETARFPHPHGHNMALPAPLEAGQMVRVRQRTATAQSDWSVPETVADHTQEYPHGPPRPVIDPGPVYACGSRTGVSNLLAGGSVWITADGGEVGRVDGCREHQGVNVNPDYSLGQVVRAHYQLCDDPSAPSEASTAGPPPPLPRPDVPDPVESGEKLWIGNIVNGARVTVWRGTTELVTYRCWGYALEIGLSPPFTPGERFEAVQRMCPSDPPSPTGTGTVQPCSALGAPGVAPVQLGDQHIHVTDFHPGAVIEVYVNLVHKGTGTAPIVGLDDPIAFGDVIHVGQVVGTCVGQTVLELDPVCVAPPVGRDPSDHNIFPVGHQEYLDGDVHGSVYYPAQDDGASTPFNERLAESGRVPIVFLVHGRHSPADPSYLGYEYLQRELARAGIIAASVDQNALNGDAHGVGNIEHRADLAIEHIVHFQNLDAAAGDTFSNRIDFDRVSLMGHSRGGDAVITVPTVIALAGVRIRSVLALAPTNARHGAGLDTNRPTGHAFMTLLPAGDGDVRRLNGAQFYDQATDVPYKSQVHVENTNHNFFNREWLFDDGVGGPMLSRYEHERVLSSYAMPLYRESLLGHSGMIDYLSNHRRPASARSDKVRLSFGWPEALTVDDHDENNTIDKNSLEGDTDPTGLAADEFAFHQHDHDGLSPFNASFFGESLGMVAQPEEVNGTFRSELPDPVDVAGQEIWIRAAEVYQHPLAAQGTSFDLGLEDGNETVVWVSVDDVGGLPRPYLRRAEDLASRHQRDLTKTMLHTFRFPSGCFAARNRELQLEEIRAILIRLPEENRLALAFDDLQIVERTWS